MQFKNPKQWIFLWSVITSYYSKFVVTRTVIQLFSIYVFSQLLPSPKVSTLLANLCLIFEN